MSRRALLLPVLCALAASSTGPARADDWPVQGGDPARTGLAGERAGPGVTPCWTTDLARPLLTSPVVADGHVVVASPDGAVTALDALTGDVRWTRGPGEVADEIAASPALARGRVLLASGQGRVTCLALETGQVLWDRPAAGGGPRAALLVAGDLNGGVGGDVNGDLNGDVVLVSFGFPTQELRALDLLTGATRWSIEAGAVSYSAPAVGQGPSGTSLAGRRLVVFGRNDGVYQARDLHSGALVWTYSTGGRVLLAAPLLVDGWAYLLPGGDEARLFAVPLDPAAHGSAWSVALTDPALPPAWAIVGQSVATGAPAWTGSQVAGLVRFDTVLDLDPPWFVPDTWTHHERAFTVDPASHAVTWQDDLVLRDDDQTVPGPLYGHCPAPLALRSAGGSVSLCRASSLEARLAWNAPGGAGQGTLLLGSGGALAERWADAASPALANGRLFLCTAAGQVVALSLSENTAPCAPTVNTPAGAAFHDAGTLTWTPGSDPEDAPGALTHLVRFDEDGEVLLDAAYETTVPGGTSQLALPPGLLSDRPYTVRLRARDPQGALSEWSPATTVILALVPEPARQLSVIAISPDTARLEWTASPSDFVAGYRVSQRRLSASAGGGEWSQPVDVGPVTRCTIGGLLEGAPHEVRVVAVSRQGRESAPLVASFTPAPPVLLDGRGFYRLKEALAAARPGQLLALGAGVFRDPEPLVLPRGVVLRGQGAHRTRIAGTGLGALLRCLAAGSTGERAAGEDAAAQPTRLEDVSLFGAEQGIVVEPGASLELTRAVIYDTQDALVLQSGARATARHLTVVDNRRAGITVSLGATLSLTSSVVSRNDVGLDAPGSATTTWCAILGNTTDRRGQAASDSDSKGAHPRFRDPAARDYREAPDSPTIDAGDPQAPVDLEPAPHGGRVNQGAYGGTAEAATSGAVLAGLAGGGGGGGGGGCALAAHATIGAHHLALWPILALLGLLLRGGRSLRPQGGR